MVRWTVSSLRVKDVELRILGATKIVTLPWRALIMATGNNISFYGDTSRRVLMARLEPTEEKPGTAD